MNSPTKEQAPATIQTGGFLNWPLIILVLVILEILGAGLTYYYYKKLGVPIEIVGPVGHLMFCVLQGLALPGLVATIMFCVYVANSLAEIRHRLRQIEIGQLQATPVFTRPARPSEPWPKLPGLSSSIIPPEDQKYMPKG